MFRQAKIPEMPLTKVIFVVVVVRLTQHPNNLNVCSRPARVVRHASMDANSPLTPESAQQRGGASSSSAPGPRRSHQKSRLGCKTCKSRKIKCDEQKPACGNCIRHQVNCDFIETSAAPPCSLSTNFLDLNMDELELLHNYATSTYATLSESPVVRDFYRINVVQIGLECDYVMRSLLAVSSLQLAYYRPHMREHYRSTAVYHHEIASRIAGNLIPDLNASIVENLFLFSALTVFYAFGSPRRDDELRLAGESGIPSWFFLHQGTRALSELANAQFDGPLAPIFQHGIDRWEAREVSRQTASPVNQHLDRLQTSIERSEPDAGLRNTYINAISELRKSFLSMECGRGQTYEVTDIFVWVFQVGDDFVPLLRVPTQSAVAILAFFCVLLRGLKSQWWLNGWADYLMAKSYALLDREHRLWIQWPMEEIGYIP
ncbi:hypothetical protein F4678DRAFT_419660 [Xylaria arbuscula]|nr:hypothetical protein F4678DRAFT_419660 [Xylaria arbuscula]